MRSTGGTTAGGASFVAARGARDGKCQCRTVVKCRCSSCGIVTVIAGVVVDAATGAGVLVGVVLAGGAGGGGVTVLARGGGGAAGGS
jgi:hypothetical protein